MEEIVCLVHRIPYPPDKGDKIRSFNLLRELSSEWKVHLGCFVDNDEDWVHVETLRAWCASVHAERRPGPHGLLAAPLAPLRGEPLTLSWYRSPSFMRWVREVLEHRKIRHVLAYSSAMAQYLEPAIRTDISVTLDMVDVDSAKWARYGREQAGIKGIIYRREGRQLGRYEAHVTGQCSGVALVTEPETELLRQRLPQDQRRRVFTAGNGVDTRYFSPDGQPSPEPATLVFTGAMDYWANEDAVCWFCGAVWPLIRQQQPQARIFVVGARPGPKVKALGELPGVEVTGRVEDVRPWLARAALAIAPLRIARGIQNKVLEAMAMAKPVVATPDALEGIDVQPGLAVDCAADPESFAAACLRLLARPPAPAVVNRRFVEENYSWSARLRPLLEHVRRGAP